MHLTEFGTTYKNMKFGGRFLEDTADHFLWEPIQDGRKYGAVRYLGIQAVTGEMFLEPYEISNTIETMSHWLYGMKVFMKDKDIEIYLLDAGDEVIVVGWRERRQIN